MDKATRWILISLVFFIPWNLFLTVAAVIADAWSSHLNIGGVTIVAEILCFFFFVVLLRRARGENWFGRKLNESELQNRRYLSFWMVVCLVLPTAVFFIGGYVFENLL